MRMKLFLLPTIHKRGCSPFGKILEWMIKQVSFRSSFLFGMILHIFIGIDVSIKAIIVVVEFSDKLVFPVLLYYSSRSGSSSLGVVTILQLLDELEMLREQCIYPFFLHIYFSIGKWRRTFLFLPLSFSFLFSLFLFLYRLSIDLYYCS